MKIFDEKQLVNENITLQNRLNYRYYLLDPMFNHLQELDFLDNVVINRKLNTVSELTFTTPAVLEPENINFSELIKPHYIIEARSDAHVLYFLVMKQDIKFSRNEKQINFQVLEYPRQLAKDIVHEYDEISKTILEVTDDILSESSWKVVYVDSDFSTKKRTFSFKQQTVLEVLQNMAQTFNAILEWNVPRKEISFVNPNRLRVNRGLVLNSEKYLEGVDLEVNAEEVITKLYLYGKDNISIEKLTPTGGRYLEDYSWFMKPFEMDEVGNVLKSSNYMTDGLCISLTNYQQLLRDNNGRFEDYLEQKETLEQQSFELWLTLTELRIDLSIITEELDVLNSTNGSSSDINDAISRKIAKESEIAVEEAQLNVLKDSLDDVDREILELNELLKKENNFTEEELLELDNFSIQRVFQDSSIEDSKDLLDDGIELFRTINKPTIKANIDITNFYQNEEYKFDWGKMQFGELIVIEIEDLGIDITAQVTEETYTENENKINVVLQNEHSSAHSSELDMTKLLYDTHSTSATVNMDKYKWDLAEDANDTISKILNNAWDATKNQVQGGTNQSVTLSERGLIIRSSDNPNNLLVAQNGVLGLSRDGGNTWRTAITPEGVFAETIVGRLIMGNRLVIEDENGIIKLDGDRQTIYDPQENEKVILGRLDDEGNYGIKIKQGAFHLEGGITSEDINPELLESLQYDDTQLREDLRLEAPLPNNIAMDGSGITATSSGDSNKFARLDYRGLYAQGGAIDVRTGTASNRGVIFDGSGIRGYNSSGTKTFEVDTNGNLTANTGTFGGTLNAATGTFSGNLSAAGGTFSGSLSAAGGTFTGSLSGNYISGAIISGGSITGGSININDRFKVDSFGNISASTGTFGGTLNAAGGTFTGTLNGNSIVGANISGGTISAGTYYGADGSRDKIDFGSGYISMSGDGIRVARHYRSYLSIDGQGNFFLYGNDINGYINIVARFNNKSGSGGHLTINEITVANFNNNSARELKKNIKKADFNGLKKVMSTPIYQYHFKTQDDRELMHTGTIYDESPAEMVSPHGDAISPYAMTSILWKAVQELNQKVVELEQELKENKK